MRSGRLRATRSSVSSTSGRVMPMKVGSQACRPRPSPARRTSLQKSPLASGSLAPRPTTTSAVLRGDLGVGELGRGGAARAPRRARRARVDAERAGGAEARVRGAAARGVERERQVVLHVAGGEEEQRQRDDLGVARAGGGERVGERRLRQLDVADGDLASGARRGPGRRRAPRARRSPPARGCRVR